MSHKAKRMAEAVVSAMSRRRFLGRLARLAGGAAAGVGGLLVGTTLHGSPSKRILCCGYISAEGISYSVCRHNKCPESMGPRKDWLLGYYEVSDCSECG